MATDLIFSRPPITGTPVHLVFGSAGAPPPAAGGIKAFDGTAWVTATAKRWNGSAWAAAFVRCWDGAAWVPPLLGGVISETGDSIVSESGDRLVLE